MARKKSCVLVSVLKTSYPAEIIGMPFLTEIRCPTNGLLLASFSAWGQYYYRTDWGAEFPLQVDYAWCHRCERFVECERLPSVDELQSKVTELVRDEHDWSVIDGDERKRWRATFGQDLPDCLTQASLRDMWCAAVNWRKTRQSPPRCLECGSFFAISVLPESQDVLVSGARCLVRVDGGSHASVAGFPDRVFYSSEGIRVDQERWDDYRRRRGLPGGIGGAD